MSKRLELHAVLCDLLGTANVYFQPPSTIKMAYPCIVYRVNDFNTFFANDKPYVNNTQYQIAVIDSNPDSLIPEKIGKLPLSSFIQHFTADNLNHYIFNIYY